MTEPRPIFCDYNAGAPVEPDVLERFATVERDVPGNPASVHGSGRRARAVLEAARAEIATALAVHPDEVVFTSGGTEAANLAVRGLGDRALPVLLAPHEHPAVLAPATERGTVEWAVDRTGTAAIESPASPVGLLALVHAQSELGTLQPIRAAGDLAQRLGVPLVVDCAQSLGRVPLDDVVARADAFVLSPHKCGGLRGHGVLVVRRSAGPLTPLLRGGSQEGALRAGTQSPALASANALAITRAVREQAERHTTMARNRAAFLAGLEASGARCTILTPLTTSVPNTVMLALPGHDGRNLLPMLDLAGVQASHGSACSAGSPTPPRVLRAIGLDDDIARACIRFSFGYRDDPATTRACGERVGAVVQRRSEKN